MKKTIKNAAATVLYYGGGFELLRYIRRKRVTILMYHRFSEREEPFKISQKVFDRQLSYLSRKYNIVSFDRYVRVLQGSREQLPPNPLIITIDDGFRDNYEYAYPILKKYNAPATIFLTTDFILHHRWLWPNRLEYILKNSKKTEFKIVISNNIYELSLHSFFQWHQSQLILFNALRTLGDGKDTILDELAFLLGVSVPRQVTLAYEPLTVEDILYMQKGNINFGSHTCSHPILSSISYERIRSELANSKKELEAMLDRPVTVICYPNGTLQDISEEVVCVAREAGYFAGVTTVPATNSLRDINSYVLGRCSVSSGDYAEIAKILGRLPVSRKREF